VTWRPAPRTPDAAAIHTAAEAARVADPERYRLDGAGDAVVAKALRGESDDALGDPSDWRPGLEQYLASAADEGRLNALGSRMARDTATGRLRARVALSRLWADRPTRAERPAIPPIVIIGGWRTGTTYLFRCLASDERLRAPLPAELTAPWRFVGLDPAERVRKIEASAPTHDLLHVLNPTLAAVHDSGAWLAEECVLALGTDLRNWGFTSTVRLPSYVAWLADQDMGPAYRTHARVLGALDAEDGRRWVLKAPAHTAELPALAAAFPGACIVHLHRDPVETVASGASLFATFRSTYSDAVDPVELGASMLDQTELWLQRAERFRSSPQAAGVAMLDLRYQDLVEDPVAAFTRVYAAAGMDPPADLPGMLAGYDAAHPRGAHGPHKYRPADFAIDDHEVRARLGPFDRSAPEG
jgi:hypothetical protein